MNAGYKQLYCPSCGYRISRESPNTYTTQYDTCELNPRLQFEEYSLNYYKNELELKKQKINELQHRIEILLSEKDEFSFKLDKSRHQVRAIEKDFDKELKQTIRKFEEKENDMRLMISNLKDELDHQTRKYEDSTVFKLNSLRRENENLRMINKNYLDVIETVLPFISKLNEGSKPSLRKKCIQSCELNHVMDNLKEFQSGLKDLQTFLISSSVKQIDNPKEKGIYGFQRKVDELQKDNENLR